LGKDKKHCEYDNIRAHFADVRNVYKMRDIENSYKNDIKKGFKEDPDNFHPLLSKKRIELMESTFKNALEFPKMKKQNNNPRVMKKINDYIEKKRFSIHDRLVRFIEYIRRNIGDWSVFERGYQSGPIVNIMILYEALIMDFYLLSRLFKIFSNTNDNQPETAKNVIIYAGADHCRIYIRFLVDVLNFDFEIFEQTGESSAVSSADANLCIDISAMSSPLFKYDIDSHSKNRNREEKFLQYGERNVNNIKKTLFPKKEAKNARGESLGYLKIYDVIDEDVWNEYQKKVKDPSYLFFLKELKSFLEINVLRPHDYTSVGFEVNQQKESYRNLWYERQINIDILFDEYRRVGSEPLKKALLITWPLGVSFPYIPNYKFMFRLFYIRTVRKIKERLGLQEKNLPFPPVVRPSS